MTRDYSDIPGTILVKWFDAGQTNMITRRKAVDYEEHLHVWWNEDEGEWDSKPIGLELICKDDG